MIQIKYLIAICVIFILLSCENFLTNDPNVIEWEQLTNSPSGGSVSVFYLNKDAELFASSRKNSNIYKSVDKGLNWENISSYDYKTIDVHGSFYALNEDDNLYKSTDFGQSWAKYGNIYIPFPGGSVKVNSIGNVIISSISDSTPDTPDDIYYIDISSNSSAWKNIFTSKMRINCLFLASNNFIFCLADQKLYRSWNGLSWDETQINSTDYANVSMIESKDNTIYLAVENLIYSSTDWGNNWDQISTPFEEIRLSFIDANNKIYFYSPTTNSNENSLFVTSDSFNSWNTINLPATLSPYHNSLYVDNNEIYIETEQNGLFISYDSGDTWNYSGLSDIKPNLSTMFIDKDDNIHLGSYYSSDNGNTWDRTKLLGDYVVITSDSKNNLFAYDREFIYSSNNLFTSYKKSYLLPGYSFEIDNNDFWYIVNGTYVSVSIDEGTSWEKYIDNFYGTLIKSDNFGNVYSTNGSGLYISSDGGKTWTLRENYELGQITAIAVDLKGNVYLQTGRSGVVKSKDKGITWEVIYAHSKDERFHPYELFIDSKNNIFLGGQGKIIYSLDDGKNWSSFSVGNPYVYRSIVGIQENSLGHIFIATYNDWIYKATL